MIRKLINLVSDSINENKIILKIIIKISVFITLVVASYCSQAQVYNSFQVSLEEGLSNSSVKAICIDHLGYVWMGTEHGLNRFDGFETVKYFNDKNDNSTISGNDVTQIFKDMSGNIWVFTSGSLNLFNRANENFQRITADKVNGYVRYIYEDETNVWFVNAKSTLFLYDKKTGIFQSDTLQHTKIKNYKSRFVIQKVCEFNRQYLLLAVASKGLYLLDKKNKTVSPYFSLPIHVYTGIEMIGNDIWAASRYGGVYKVDKNENTVINYNPKNSELTSSIILDLKKSPTSNNLWIATDGNGIFEFTENFDLINHFTSGSRVDQPLPDNSVQTIYLNEGGDMWFGTVRSGAVLLYPGDFIHFPYTYNTISGPSNRTILRLFEDNKNNIWLGTDGGGLNKFNPETYSFKSFSNDEFDKVTGIVSFSDNILLLSVFRQKLVFFNTLTNTFTNAHKHPLLTDIGLNKLYRLFRDSENNIWIWDDRLWRINPEKGEREVFTPGNTPAIYKQLSPIFYSVFEDKNTKHLWFGANGGFYGYNLREKKFEDVFSLLNIWNSYGYGIYSILTDNNGDVVFGTSRGLYKYDTESKLISDYFENIQFNNTIFRSLWVTDEVLWAATSEGILKLESEDLIIKIQEDSHEFRNAAILQASDSNVYLGTNNGILKFSPQSIKADTLSKNAIITTFTSSGTQRGSEITQSYLSDLNRGLKLEIPFSNSVYKFGFNSFDIPFHEKTQYSYLLDGFEEVWHTGTVRLATYTNLSPGEYTFHVKSSTSTGFWNDKTTQIKFEILPPWWQTIWFKIFAIMLVFGIALLIWIESLKRAKLKYLVQVEKHLVQVEKNEQKRLKEVNQMKLRFFTNISHELRTPLTLIYSPLKKMIGNSASIEEIKKGLPGLYRNTQRMKHLVDQILEFRKAEMDELSLNLKNEDFIDFCRGVIDSFHFMAETEGINIKFSHEDTSLYLDFDHDKFTKILFNLISNALKHTTKGGFIELNVESENKWVHVSLSDSGKGIDESKLETIFERYYQVENNVEGTGIGLALTKKLVSLHDGEIWAESKPGEGAVFRIKIPKLAIYDAPKTAATVSDKTTQLPKIEKPKQGISQESTSGLSLLIIEDDWELRHYLETEFQTEYKVYTAANGKIGLYEAIENLPDVIITDVMMPELNGFEFCKALRADLRISHIPVVMLTAKTMSENQIEGYKAGADLYISKPFDKEILQSQIQALLANRELLKKRFGHDLGFSVKEITHSETDEKLLHKAISIVEMNMQDTQFDVNGFVDNLGISRTLAYKKIKAISGKAINDFILSVRLQKARMLLKQTNKTISEIAFEIGFSEPSYFSAVFKKNYEMSPSEFRQNSTD